MKSPELYYEASRSKTRFQALPPDPEDVGLDDFRRAERDKIIEFCQGDPGILVMGGFSGAGKSELFRTHCKKTSGIDFFDAMQFLSDRTNKGIVDVITSRRESNQENASVLLIDEGYAGIVARPDTLGHWREAIERLFEKYSHLVIGGGGIKYTSEEQTEQIAGCMPSSIPVITHPFHLKTLNTRQTTELVERSDISIFPGVRLPSSVAHKVPHRAAQLMAEAQVDYFRLPRQVIFTRNHLCSSEEGYRKMSSLESQLESPVYGAPLSCAKTAWAEQAKLLEERFEEIMRLLEGNQK